MKKGFLFVQACGIYAGLFAQNEIALNDKNGNGNNTDKWVITPVKNLKGEIGQLDMNFPWVLIGISGTCLLPARQTINTSLVFQA